MKRVWVSLALAAGSLAGTTVWQTVWGQPETTPAVVAPVVVAQAPRLTHPPAPPLLPPTEKGPALPDTKTDLLLPIAPPAVADSPPLIAPPAVEPTILRHPTVDRENVLPVKAEAPAPVGEAPKTLRLDGAGRQEPGVSIEWAAPHLAKLNQPLPCQIIVRNVCPVTVHQVVVRYPLPAGVTIRTCEPKGTAEGNALTWSFGSLPPGQMRRIDLQLVSQERGELTCNATVTFSGTSVMRVQVREPKLHIKTTGVERAVVGDTVTLQCLVSNPGDGPTETVKIKAMLPEGLEHSRGRVVELEVGNLAPQESRPVSIVCTAKSEGQHMVPVTANSEGGLNASEMAKIEVLAPRLDLALIGPKQRYIDRPAVFQFKISNPGVTPATNVTLTDVLPAGFKFTSASSGGRHEESSRTVSWMVGDLMPGQSREVTLNVIAASAGDHRQLASVSAARGAKNEVQLVTHVEGLSALLMEMVDVEDPVEVGTETAYEIRITNTGTKPETNLELVCTLPDKMEYLGAKNGAGSKARVEGRDVIFEALPRLAPKADVIYRINVRGTGPGDLRFRARIRADGLTEPVLREESTKVYSDDAPGR